MAFENLCMYCFEETGGADVCPHCGRDARAAVPQIQLLPGTLVYNDRFLIGRALGQDASGIVYAALDTRKNVKIRIREYLPRDCARRLNSGEVVPEPGAEDQFEAGMNKLRAALHEEDIECVFVLGSDRIATKHDQLALFLQEAKDAGVKVYAICTGEPEDLEWMLDIKA